MSGAQGRAAGGCVEDVARAIAAAVRRRRVVAAVALGVSIAWCLAGGYRSPLSLAWVVAASFLTGALFARPSRGDGWTPGMGPTDTLVVAIAGFAVLVVSMERGVPEWIAQLAVAGLAVELGSDRRSRIAAVCALVLGLVALVPLVSFEASPLAFAPWPPARHWLVPLGFAVVARHGRWTRTVAFVVLLFVWWCAALRLADTIAFAWNISQLTRRDIEGLSQDLIERFLLVPTAWIVVPWVAARAGAALTEDDHGDAVTRLVVRVQRAPWRMVLIVFVAGVALFISVDRRFSPHAQLLVAMTAMTCLSLCIGANSALRGALVSIAAAALLLMPLSVALGAGMSSYYYRLEIVPRAVLVLVAPIAVGLAVCRTRTQRFPWWGWLTVTALCSLAIVNWDGLLWEVDSVYEYGFRSRDMPWLLTVCLLVHAVATSQVSARLVVGLSPIASVLVFHTYFKIWGIVPDSYHRLSPILPALLAGPAAALLALGARRVRSMTALPAGHPALAPAAARRGFPEA